MVPSKNAVASKPGLGGHHCTWKAQLSADGSYGACELTFEAASRNNDAYFANDLRGLWVPTKRTVILATGQQEIRVLLTP
jgi:hypothetical protein